MFYTKMRIQKYKASAVLIFTFVALICMGIVGCTQTQQPAQVTPLTQANVTTQLCDLTTMPHERLVTGARVGFSLRVSASRRIMLPASPTELVSVSDLIFLLYPEKKVLSYQMITDSAYDRKQGVGISLPEAYRKVYGLSKIEAGDEEQYNVSGLRQMLDIECGAPNFKKYILRDGDIAIIQRLDGRYWTLIFPKDDLESIYNFEFRNYLEAEVKLVLGTWKVL